MRLRVRLLRTLLPLAVLVVMVAAGSRWAEQQMALVRIAEDGRVGAVATARAAEGRAVAAEASLTAIGRAAQAVVAATATETARGTEPRDALERALGQLFGVFQDPTGPNYDRLGEWFGPEALSVVRPEADYLRANDLHLGGSSTFKVDSAAPIPGANGDTVKVETHERWQYDERSASDQSARCFVESSEQTYTLTRAGKDWQVTSVTLGTTTRTGC